MRKKIKRFDHIKIVHKLCDVTSSLNGGSMLILEGDSKTFAFLFKYLFCMSWNLLVWLQKYVLFPTSFCIDCSWINPKYEEIMHFWYLSHLLMKHLSNDQFMSILFPWQQLATTACMTTTNNC